MAECPTGCGRALKMGHLLCGACWSRVPRALQRDVWRTWRTYQKTPTDRAWSCYTDAREAALAAIA